MTDDIGDEFRVWLEAGAPAGENSQGQVLSASAGGVDETWDSALLDRDIRAVAAEYLTLSRNPSLRLATVRDLALDAPPLYARYVVEQALILLSQYALHAAPQLEVKPIFESCAWLVRVARQYAVIEIPPA